MAEWENVPLDPKTTKKKQLVNLEPPRPMAARLIISLGGADCAGGNGVEKKPSKVFFESHCFLSHIEKNWVTLEKMGHTVKMGHTEKMGQTEKN